MADGPDTVAGLLAARAADTNPGLVTAGGDRTWTWAEVVAESAARVPALEAAGVAGRHVGVLLENVPEFVFLLGAAALSGTVVVGVNPTRRGEELARDIRHTRCELVLTDASLASLLDGIGVDDRVALVDGEGWRGSVDRDPQRIADALAAAPTDPDALYLLLFTSGSTAAPKAVRMSQGRAARTAAAGAAAFTPADVLYCSMPLFHGNALLANLLPAMVSGASVVLKRRFSASELLADVRRHRCTYFNYVGRALSYVLAQPPTAHDAENDLVWCLGSEASPQDRTAFRRRFGCHVVEAYSSSEGGVVIRPFPGMPPDALGRPPEGADVVVLDPETGAECPPACFDADGRLLNADEAIGEIVGRDGLAGFEGYWDNPDADAERGRDGWYWSGDLGYRDAEGTFWFAGRTADWLRVDGENFAAAPVERILGRFEPVASVVVYAVPDPRTGDQVMAALELAPGAAFDPTAFDAFLAGQADLGTKWAPRFVRVTAGIPLTATGKVDRKPLRAERWSTEDPVWWRPTRSDPYRRLTALDRAALEAEFAEHGRAAVLRT